jgi:hypothetical protein
MNKPGNRFTLIAASAVLAALLVWLGMTAAKADLTPATAPATLNNPNNSVVQPTPRNQPNEPVSLASDHTRPMPRQYAVLLSRSMFVRGHAAEMGHIGLGGQQRYSAPSTAPSLDRSETGLIFNGVTKTANTIDALVEDTVSSRVLTVKPGDAVARGTVKSITFDTLEYESGGKVIQVHIGQNFTGNEVDTSTIPTAAATAPAPTGASPEDILERLRQKRLQELGGGR